MSHAWRATVAMVLGVVLILAGVGGSIWYTNSVAHELCVIINLADAQKPPAGANSRNPSREYEQRLYSAFEQVGRDYDC